MRKTSPRNGVETMANSIAVEPASQRRQRRATARSAAGRRREIRFTRPAPRLLGEEGSGHRLLEQRVQRRGDIAAALHLEEQTGRGAALQRRADVRLEGCDVL